MAAAGDAVAQALPKSPIMGGNKPLKSSIKSLLNRSPRLKRTATRLYDGLFGLLYEES
jgi:hypothetical protein